MKPKNPIALLAAWLALLFGPGQPAIATVSTPAGASIQQTEGQQWEGQQWGLPVTYYSQLGPAEVSALAVTCNRQTPSDRRNANGEGRKGAPRWLMEYVRPKNMIPVGIVFALFAAATLVSAVRSAPEHNPPRPIRLPNAFGVADMIGNVRNWCADWFSADYYANSPKDDPAGPATGRDRIVRGAAFHYYADMARPAVRFRDPPPHRHGQLGFRVVREVK